MTPLNPESKFTGILFSIIAAINGKHKVLPVFYSAREHVAGSASASWVHLDVLARDPEYANEYQTFIRISAEYLMTKSEISLQDAKRVIYEAFEFYIENMIEKKKMQSVKQESNVIPVKKNSIPWLLKKAIKKVVPNAVLKPIKNAFAGSEDEIGSQDVIKTAVGEQFGYYITRDGILHFYDLSEEKELRIIHDCILGKSETGGEKWG
jgi:hypothetical protein